MFEKKILNETKNHNPPPPSLQVKWSVPYPQRVHIWSLCSILLLSTEGPHMVTMLHALIINRGSTHGHYALYSYYPQRVHIWSLCSILFLSTERPHIVIMLYTLIINRGSAYGHNTLYSYYPQSVRI